MAAKIHGIKAVYRYQSMSLAKANDKGETYQDWTLDVLRNNWFRFSAHSEFKDWFDCRTPRIGTIEEYSAFFVRELKKTGTLNPARQRAIDKKVRQIEAGKVDDLKIFYEQSHAFLDRMISVAGVKCFCGPKGGEEHNNNMWIQYADDYKGLCLLFDGANKFFKSLQEVKYPKKKLPIKVIIEEEDNEILKEGFERSFCQKSPDFSYEDEYRMVSRDGAGKFYKFPKDSLIGVQFGFRMTQNDKHLVKRTLVKCGYSKVELFDMEPDVEKAIMRPRKVGEIL